jgi:hypothetical protein
MPEPVLQQEQPRMAFIVGIGRSGTTMLTSMLNMHPEVIATPENEFILFSHSSFAYKNFNDPEVVKAFINMFDYNYNNVINIWKPSPDFEKSIAQLRVKNFANVCKLAYLHYPLSQKDRSGVKWVIDKNPSYSMHIQLLHRLYPEAKFIVIVRDYRDNVVSRKKYSDKAVSLLNLAAAWNFFYEKIYRSIKALGLSAHLVRYEDLAQAPEKTLQSLCDYLGVTYDPQMLQFQGFSKKIKDHARVTVSEEKFEKIASMHSNLDKAVNTDRVDAFRDELSPAEIALLDMACHQYGKQFNYKPLNDPAYKTSFADRLKYSYAYCQVVAFNFIKTVYYKLPVSFRLRFKQKRLWNN